nr:hypothetical protein [uncultured Flavobacterium sp.]
MKPFYTILLVLFILFLFKPTIVSIIEKKTNSSIINESLEQEDNEKEKIIIFFNQAKKNTNKQELTITAIQIINTDTVFFTINHIQKINTPPPRFV